MSTQAAAVAPIVCRLTIERFRGIKHLVWHPSRGVNIILGGGDVGKTTVLDAIALLLHPTNATVVSDADYWRRETEQGFAIEAIMALPDRCGLDHQGTPAWPWEWDGKNPQLPNPDRDPTSQQDVTPVYRLRLRGTPEFDLLWEVHQPDDTSNTLSVAVRRQIGLVRLGGDDRNDRDLRLIHGSALDRLLSDRTLRSRLGQKLADNDIAEQLTEDAKKRLDELDTAFADQSLPTELGLALTGGPGMSLNALIGLVASKDSVELPLASWGAGTRRLAALAIAATHQGENPITIVDEVERGLEPYRQRGLMSKLETAGSQAFVTTHSAAALGAAPKAAIWHMSADGTLGRLPDTVDVHRLRDPETFLARLTIVAEGATEVGFVRALLERAIGQDLLQRGIWITDGCGHDCALALLEALTESGLAFACFADNEGRAPARWDKVKQRLGTLLFRWTEGCLEENIIKLLTPEQLPAFIADSDGESGARLRTLALRAGVNAKELPAIQAQCLDLTRLLCEAATGFTPPDRAWKEPGEQKAWKKHAERWFKSEAGGAELGAKVFGLGLWPKLEDRLLPFVNAVRTSVSMPALATLSI